MAEKYIVIADKLEIELKKMRSEGRMKLPSENSLSEQFSCSRQTVRAALDILKKAGLIEKRNGSGSYIVEESKKNKTVYFITEDCDRYLSPALISGLRSELTSSKYVLKAFSTMGSGKEEAAAISRAISEKAAAIIIEPVRDLIPNANDRLIEDALALRIPVIYLNSSAGPYGVVRITPDYREAGKILTDKLRENGRQKIACIFCSDSSAGMDEYKGYIGAVPAFDESLCLLIEMDGCKILNLGDATEWTLKQLALQGYDLSDIDIWMFNHHGIQENNPAWWIDKIAPTIAISNCCGESKGTYRSWAKDVYTRCENAGVNCYSTQYNGDLVFTCIGGIVFPEVERNGQTMTRNGRTVVFNKSAKKYWRGNFTRRNRLPRDLAVEVMLQMWGRNPERSEKIRAGGYDPDEVQAYVNLYAQDETELLWAMADYVWQGFAGSGVQRKNILTQTGKYDYYDKVQEYVKLVDDVAQQVLAGRYGQNPDRAI